MKQYRIPFPPLFSFDECLWFLDRNYDDCLHYIEGGRLWKALDTGTELVLLELHAEKDVLVLDIHGSVAPAAGARMVEEVRDWLGMNDQPEAFYALLRNHPALSYMTEAFYGLRLIGISSLYEALCWSIIGQQINLKFAYALKRRLVERYGRSVEYGGKCLHVFPRPEDLAGTTVEELRAMQFSGRKAEYLLHISTLFASGALSRAQLEALPPGADRVKALTAIRGIGTWTANYALMKCLREPGAVPYGDVGLLNALLAHGLISDKKDTEGLRRLFEGFPGWESYLVLYLWRSLAVPDFQSR